MSEARFDRDAVRAFHFRRCGFDRSTGIAELVYGFDDGPDLIERLAFPGTPFDLDGPHAAAVTLALRLVHLVAGVSYYKAAVPDRIRIDSYAIDADTASLLTMIYAQGLGEFAYRNLLDLHDRIAFPVEVAAAPTPGSIREGRGAAGPCALVAIGGGKDSLVSIESLRAAGVKQTVAWIGGSQLIAACAARTGLPVRNIGRTLAPELFDYNRQGAFNGHIPVTAVNSAILVLAAILGGDDHVVFSNERSASYGSFIPGAGEVNHQWSKGWEFERAFGAHVETRIAPGLRYYSLLRPYSELAVARVFSRTHDYDAHFSSCNRNFHLLGERPTERWCGACPKCHFVFLALAPFMPKARLVWIFGRNLLDDPSLAADFDALLEFGEHKPFECVGEGRESRAAMAAIADRAEWREDALVARFVRSIAPQLAPEELVLAPLLVGDDEHRIPDDVWSRVRAHLGT